MSENDTIILLLAQLLLKFSRDASLAGVRGFALSRELPPISAAKYRYHFPDIILKDGAIAPVAAPAPGP